MGWRYRSGRDKGILITHQDTDHVGAVEQDSDLLFKGATLYIGEIKIASYGRCGAGSFSDFTVCQWW